MSAKLFSLSDVARKLGVAPRAISDLLYQRKLDEARCPLIGGRRLIPEDFVPDVRAALRAAGKIKK